MNMSPVSLSLRPRRAVSRIALAVALACGVALTATAIEAPVHAQKKQKKDAEPKKDFSEAFIKTYQPYEPLASAQPRDGAALRAAVPSVMAAATTPDDRLVAGNFAYQAGAANQDKALQQQGLEMMLGSGKLPAENVGSFSFAAGQFAYEAQDYDAARRYLQASMDAGYTENDPRALIAESYFQQERAQEGIEVLKTAIQQQVAAGQVPERGWLKRGLGQSYTANLNADAMQFGQWLATYYPDKESWGDAIVVVRNLGEYDDAQMLDLLRLQRRTGTFRDGREYIEYVDSADPRRLPGEVAAVIEEGYASGLLDRGNSFISDARTSAQDRIAADKADLPSIERDANAGSAKLNVVLAAADTFMNYDQPGKAEAFYRKALEMPGADRGMILTRLGIAQVDQGQFAQAQATFEQVEGPRQSVARLWALYALQQGGVLATPVS